MSMASLDALRYTRIPLTHGSGAIPAVGFGTLIPDRIATVHATTTAFEVGFRHFDCAERYRNEDAVGDAMQAVFRAGKIGREDVFVTTKLWNTNHRPERVKPAFEGSLRRLQLDYADCYLIPRVLDEPVITRIAERVGKTPAQVALAWAVQRGTAFLTTSTKPANIQANFDISVLPEDAIREMREAISANVRFNSVVETGVPGFIPRVEDQEREQRHG
jgi:diketogulonate reductase-like aldo/keto reductase